MGVEIGGEKETLTCKTLSSATFGDVSKHEEPHQQQNKTLQIAGAAYFASG